MKDTFFPSKIAVRPKIYAYALEGVEKKDGQLKVGFTSRDVKQRVQEQVGTAGLDATIVVEEPAMRNDGSTFTDREVHQFLRDKGISNPEGEWFACDVAEVKAAIHAVRTRSTNINSRNLSFGMRPEQKEAVEKAARFFRSEKKDSSTKSSHFLGNAKMRFGKTFASYKLAQEMGWSKVLVLTFKPAVQNAWQEDLENHLDFEGWQFISPGGLPYEDADKNKPIVCFGSFQDFLGKNKSTGGIKTKNEWVHATNWDCVILDEYHFGAWRENAKDLFESEDKKEIAFGHGEGIDDFDEEIMPITTDHYLYLSGTPFRAIASGEFIEEQIFNWTYSDEQSAKAAWTAADNPYRALPRMVLMTYQLPDSIQEIAMEGEFDEFDLNVFFQQKGRGVCRVFLQK